jgi:aminoglycoside 3-N-acetyltransferase
MDRIVRQLVDLGGQRSGVLVVHTAFSRVRSPSTTPVDLIAALRESLGPEGTLVMPTMSDDDDHPFDSRSTPCVGMGIVADTFWRLPGVLRSDSPHAFAAAGPRAADVTAAHPIDIPHGIDSPVGRVWELDGQVLLLGVGHDANTTIHLAETMAQVRYGQAKYAVVRAGKAGKAGGAGEDVHRVDYFEIDHCCAKFALLDQWLDAKGLQTRGRVDAGEARLMRSRDIVAEALEHLRNEETVFLHPAGVCDECDKARAGMYR